MIQEFLTFEEKVKNYSPHTIRAYGESLQMFCRWIQTQRGIKRFGDVHKNTIEAYLMTLHDAKYKPSTIRRHLAAIRALYNYALKQGLTTVNPAKFAEAPKLARTLPNTIDTEAIEKYIEDARQPLGMRTLVAVLYETGIRISEALSLEVRDVDYFDRSMRVYGKGLKQRKVYFGYYSERLLRTYTTGRYGDIWQGHDGNERWVRWQIHRALHAHATEGKASPHTIRHTYATRMLEQGMSLTSLQLLLGHENVETTNRYARITDTHLKKEYEQAQRARA